MEFNFNDFETNYEKIKAMLEKNRKEKRKEKLSKEEISKIRKECWADRKKRQLQSEITKMRWSTGELNPEMIYHKDYYLRQYQLTDLETGEVIVYDGLKACYTAMGYASNGGIMKQSRYPFNIHNRERTKNYSLKIIKNKGDLK